jgi:ferric-dicitrate binding protein FerR (iron transport regulator)
MNFLAPLFLVGAAAIALPILLHLIRRTERERIPFSSLMFLKQTPPTVTRRSRLENLLLLLLRCLAFALIALAFSRPYFQQAMNAATPATERRRTVVLVDTSASMRREPLWSDAVAAAR